MMLQKKFFHILSESKIRMLPGGPQRDRWYFIGILEKPGGDFIVRVIHAKLRNQMQSQKSPAFPAGYEPFLVHYSRESRFCLARYTIEVPRLTSILSNSCVFVTAEYLPACILNPRRNTDQFELLMRKAERFELEAEIRVLAARTPDTLEVAADLLAPVLAGTNGSRVSANTAERLEIYLECAETQQLRDLVQLLRLPEPEGKPGLPIAA
jgi:hypothetical protein